MPTTIKESKTHAQIATGHNIQTQVIHGQTQYLVSNIAPYPNDDLIEGNTYTLKDTNNSGLVVELLRAPGISMQTATFIVAQ